MGGIHLFKRNVRRIDNFSTPPKMENAFREATKKDFPLLREYLKTKLPSSLSILNIIDIMDKFDISRKVYVTSSDPTLFIFATHLCTQPPSFCAFWDEKRTTKEEALQYLKSIPDWKWDEAFLMFRVESTLAKYINRMIFEEGLSPPNFQRKYKNLGYIYEMTPENLPEVTLPKGFRMGKLKPHHTGMILSKWTYGEGESVAEYQEMIRKLPTAAVYKEEDTDQKNPLSWVVVYDSGAFGMTYTLPEFRRLGFATAVEFSVCKDLIEAGIPACCDVESHNKHSQEMHKKAGFKEVIEITYGFYHPLGK